jgi:uncharacterized membrane protein YbhN (UPF0104 family)
VSKRIRIAIVALLQVGVSAAILFGLVRVCDVQLIQNILAGADRGWLLGAVAALVAQQLLGAARWRHLSAILGGPKLGAHFYVLWQGMAVLLLQVLPSTIGGDVLRATSGARHGGLRHGLGVVVVDRVIGMGVLSGLVLFGGLVFASLVPQLPALLVPLAMAVVGVTGCAIVMLWGPRLALYPIAAPLSALGAALVSSLRGWAGVQVAGGSVVIHLLSVLSVVCLLYAAGAPSAAAVFFVAPSAFLVSAIPISLGGWGVREGAFVVGLGLLGVPGENALSVSMLFGVALTLAGVVLVAMGAMMQGIAFLGRTPAATEVNDES